MKNLISLFKLRNWYYIFYVTFILIGCSSSKIHNQYFDSNYNIYKDSSQSFIVEEIIFYNPILFRNSHYGPWLITEEVNLNDVTKDKSYLTRPDVYLYGNNFSYYSNITNIDGVISINYKEISSNKNQYDKEAKFVSINKNLNGFEVYKFVCDSNTYDNLRFMLGFISVNRYNKMNNYQNSYQIKSRNIYTEYRKIVYPFCVYNK